MSVEYIRAKFRIKTTPNTIGDSTYKAINDTRDVLCANAAAVPMTLGGRGGGAQWPHWVDHGRSSV